MAITAPSIDELFGGLPKEQRLDRFDPERPGELFERLAQIPDGGNTALRYSASCASNNSQLGMLTTRALIPSALSRS